MVLELKYLKFVMCYYCCSYNCICYLLILLVLHFTSVSKTSVFFPHLQTNRLQLVPDFFHQQSQLVPSVWLPTPPKLSSLYLRWLAVAVSNWHSLS